ncbi:histone deacetylase [Raphidocelis subcapitata]|uniref:Histone deacetylase n=1 Tax=Raphidocelis subcapitata TaxID=307507 RepID=A0A2V0NNH7_9CHLO|nr:histone deacetylase [Raphidocelis subcapitata]|eukprot:GBF88042.1 histone deacetylase [Raphidocelis subcapitata]
MRGLGLRRLAAAQRQQHHRPVRPRGAPPPPLLRAVSGAAAAASPPALSHPVVYHPDMRISPIPDGHRFPMPKDALLYDRLVELGLAGRTFQPTPPDVDTLCLAHDEGYVRAFLDGALPPQAMRRIGLPWSEALVRRTLIGTGSAVLAARLALQFGVAVMCNGGTHHAHRDFGAGWCIFNDQAVAARAAQRDAGMRRVLFVDLDVHQGDGTAAIFENDPSVFTFSMHCRDQGFPSQLQRSNVDIGLPAGTGDDEYLEALRDALPRLLLEVGPDLVMYNAGVDVSASDSLGKLALSDAGIAARDDFVMRACAEAGVPIAAAIGGGYAEDHAVLVDRHASLHKAAAAHLPALAAACEARRLAARRELREQREARLRTG